MVFGKGSFLWKLKYEQHIKIYGFLLKLFRFHKHEVSVDYTKSWKALEIISASKQKLYICIQKELKVLVTKNPDFYRFLQSNI